MKRTLFLALGLWLSIGCLAAQPADASRVIDLKPFAGPSQFTYIGTPWAAPTAALSVDGVPFKIDGVVELFGTGTARSGNGGRRSVDGIPVDAAFAELHFLGSTAWSDPDSTVIARVILQYADGTTNSLPVAYGVHVRDWFVSRRTPEKPFLAAGVAEAFRGEVPESARYDKHYRFTRFILQNPNPEKVVRSLSLVSAGKQASLMVAALSLSATPTKAAGVVVPAIAKELLPDAAKRAGAKTVLRGRVMSEAGEGLADAEVKIIGVRDVGTEENDNVGMHPSIGTSVRTDQTGAFEFKDLTDDRLYRVSAARTGFSTAAYRGADPLGARPEIRLSSPSEVTGPAAKFKIVDLAGKPVSGAMLRANSVSMNNGTTYGGANNFASLTLTDADGEAVLSRKEAFTAVQVEVSAPGFARARERGYSTGGVHKVTIGPGATIAGRVLKDGQPLAGRVIGLVGSVRNSDVFVGYLEEKTDADGRFAFKNAPPATSFNLYGDLDSFHGIGLFGPQVVTSPRHGLTNDLGDVAVAEGLSLAGRVARSDGGKIPPTMQIRFSHDMLWKGLVVKPDSEGKFEMKHLPLGLVTLYLADQRGLQASQYRLDLSNRSLTDYNSDGLEGLLSSSKDDLLILYGDRPKGSQSFANSMGSLPQGDASRSRPLIGAEESGPPNVVLAGSVVDDKTGQPVGNYRIVPGRAVVNFMAAPGTKSAGKSLATALLGKKEPDPYRFLWMENRFIEATNSDWKFALATLSVPPAIRIEAEGYESFESGPLPLGTNGLVVRLKSGAGPGGIVLGPDGKPATRVFLALGAGGDQLALFPDFRLSNFRDQQSVVTNNLDGSFTFKSRKGTRQVFASSPAGWAELPASDIGSAMKIRLKLWAAVTGMLVDSNGVAQAGVDLSLTMDFKALNAGEPFINIQGRIRTDAQGRFLFTNVPPMFLHLNKNIPMGTGNGYTHSLQAYVDPSPGKTNDLGKVVMDRPPAKPLMDQLKEKIGL